MPISNIEKKNLEKPQIYILIFVPKIESKNIQDLIFFLQKNNFSMKRITKKNAQKNSFLNIANSNFFLESKSNITKQELWNIISFLKNFANIHGIFFKNQIWSFERLARLEEQPKINLWKQICNLVL